VAEAGRCEIRSKTFVNSLSQTDHDCCGKATSWRGQYAFNTVTER
jgi:hypothetical protein